MYCCWSMNPISAKHFFRMFLKLFSRCRGRRSLSEVLTFTDKRTNKHEKKMSGETSAQIKLNTVGWISLTQWVISEVFLRINVDI